MKTGRIIIFLLLGLCIGGSCNRLDAAEILVNGNFENEPNWGAGVISDGSSTAFIDYQIPGWTIEAEHAVTVHISSGSYLVISNAYTVNLDGEGYNGVNGNLYQDFATTLGATYNLSFDWQSWGLFAVPTTGSLKVSVTDTDTDALIWTGLYTYDGAGPHPVHHISTFFQGTGNSLRLRIEQTPESGYNDNTFLADNFSVTQVSTPSVQLTTVAGGIHQVSIGGLAPGDTVRVEKFLDIDGNGAIDPGLDPLVLSFSVSDGVVPTINGIRNTSQPGDEDGAVDGNIVVLLNTAAGSQLNQVVGGYLYRVTSPSNPASPATAPFLISPSSLPQQITGVVSGGGSSVVFLFDGSKPGGEFVSGVVTDLMGNYALPAKPGTYRVAAIKPGVITSFDNAPLVSLGSSQNSVQNLSPTITTKTIYGRLSDQANSSPLAGVQVLARSTNGFFTVTTTDANGGFAAGVTDGTWTLEFSTESLAVLGFCGLEKVSTVDLTRGAAGREFQLKKSTALIYGQLTDNQSLPMAGVRVSAHTEDQDNLQAFSLTDADGKYGLAVTGDRYWSVRTAPGDAQRLGLMAPGQSYNYVTNGQTMELNLYSPMADSTIIGRVVDNLGSPVPGVELEGSYYGIYNATAVSDSMGFFTLNVVAGSWTLSALHEETLVAQGYIVPHIETLQPVSQGGTATGFELKLQRGPLQISGSLKGNGGAAIPHVQVTATLREGTNTSGFTNYTVRAMTDTNGNFSLPVFDSAYPWQVTADYPQVSQQGYYDPSLHQILLSGASQLLNITLTSYGYYSNFRNYGVGKGRSYLQTNPDTVMPDPVFPNKFSAFGGGVPAGSGFLQTPSGDIRWLDRKTGSLEFGDSFPSQIALDSIYGNGTYTLTFNTFSNGVLAVPFNLSGNTYPNPPHLTSYADLNSLDLTQYSIPIYWDPFVGGTTNDLIRLIVNDVNDMNGNEVVHTPELGQAFYVDGTAQYTYIYPGDLLGGHTYRGRLQFAKVISTNTTAYPAGNGNPGIEGVSEYFSETVFYFTTPQIADVRFISVGRGQRYVQTVTDSPIPSQSAGLQFAARLRERESNFYSLLDHVDLTVPDEFSSVFPVNSRGGYTRDWELVTSYANTTDLSLNRPDGVYSMTVTPINGSIVTVPVTIGESLSPDVPQFSNLDQLQNINPANGFFVEWYAQEILSDDDFIQLTVIDDEGNRVYETPQFGEQPGAIAGTDTSHFVPPYQLTAGRQYRVVLRFEHNLNTDTNSYPGAIVFSSSYRETEATIQTTLTPGLFGIVNTTRHELPGGFATANGVYAIAYNDEGTNRIALISRSSERIGLPITIGAGGKPPVISTDGTNFLAVWFDDSNDNYFNRNLYGRFLAPDGSFLGGKFQLTTNPADRRLASLVYGSGKFLVVWEENQPGGNGDILGAFVTPNMETPPPQISISALPTIEVDAAAATDGTNFVVAYQALGSAGASQIWNTIARRVGPDGFVSPPVQVSQNSSSDHRSVAIRFDGTRYLLAWSRDVGAGFPAPNAFDIYGRFLNAAGAVSGNEFPVATGSGSQILPSITYDGQTYLVAWTDLGNNFDSQIRGRYFSLAGKALGRTITLFQPVNYRPASQVLIDYADGGYFALCVYAYPSFYYRAFYGFYSGDIFAAFISPSAPIIYAQPDDRTVAPGSPALFSIGAAGQEPITYQWRRNGVAIPNATNPDLTLPIASAANAGTYSVTVSNLFGSVVSSNATLRVITPPLITQQPQSINGILNESASFTVVASGDGPLRYQWSLNGRNIIGATSSTLTLNSLAPRNLGTYVVVVENDAGAVDSQPAFLRIAGRDIGLTDSFANRLKTNSYSGIGTGSNVGLTREPGEPRHAGRPGGHSVWYSWIAPTNGVATFSTEGSGFDTTLAVYTGSSVVALIPVVSDDDSGGFATSRVRFNAVKGTEYQIAIDGYGDASGDIVLQWSVDSDPNTDPVPQIDQQPVSQSLAPGADATFVVIAQSPNPLTYQWYFNNLPLAGKTDATLTRPAISQSDAGSYYVVVSSGTESVLSAAAYLEISTATGVSSEDKFTDTLLDESGNIILSGQKKGTFASVSAGVLGTQILNNFGSTKELGEPIHAGVTGGASRWFSLRPDSDGVVVVDTIGSDIDTVLAVYTGTNLFTLTTIASDNNGAPDGIRSLVRFPATAGTFYRIAVDSVNGVQGHINLNWSLGTVPVFTVTPPTLQVISIGSSITLTAAADATPTPGFQWRLNGAAINGATNSFLNINSFQSVNVGRYSVTASNYAGTTNITAILALTVPTNPPSAEIVYPATNSVFSSIARIPVTVSASDSDGNDVASVDFYRGTNKVGQVSSAPFIFTLTNTPIGNYTLTARATDIFGGSVTSAPVGIRIIAPDPIRPTVSFTAPANNARLSNAVVNITGEAADNVRLVSVQGLLNSELLFTNLTGTTNWATSVTLKPGTNIFKVRSVDLLGNISLTNSRTVIYIVTNAITLGTTGSGTVKGLTNRQVLEVGKGYRLTATPSTGNLFSNWTASGTAFSTNPILSFLMSSNLALSANFVTNPFAAAKGIYNGLVMDTNNVTFTNAGLINLTVSDKGVFSGKLLLAGASLPLAGGFGVDGKATIKVNRTGKPALTNRLELDLASNESLGGNVSDGAFNVSIQAEKAVFAATKPAPYAGKYTLIVPGTNEVTGDGIGTVSISPAGTISFAGTLADGTVVSQSVPVSRDGWWPVYLPLYTGKGMLISWAQFDTNGLRAVMGDAVWIKTPQPGKYFSSGFVLKSSLDGGGYVSPLPGPTNLVLALTNGTVTLTGGNLSTTITNDVVLTNNNVLRITGTNGLKLTITPSSGLVNGSFIHPVTKAITPIKAVVQQGRTNIDGFFLGTNRSGQLILQP